MAEETKEEPKAEESKGLSPVIKKLLVAAVFLVIPACLGLIAFKFVISPMISEPEGPVIDPGELIPANAVTIEFSDLQAALKKTNSTADQYLLIYSISLVCDSIKTSDLVMARKSYFDNMIDELHRNKTIADTQDGIIVENIEMEIKIEANKILKRLNPEGSNMIIEVMHTKWTPIPL